MGCYDRVGPSAYPEGRAWSLTALPAEKGARQRPTAFLALCQKGHSVAEWAAQDGSMEVEGRKEILLQGHCGSPAGKMRAAKVMVFGLQSTGWM